MNIDRHQNRQGPSKSKAWRLTSNNKGTLLVYLVVLLLIFGVLGVSLVSLFTTSTSSTATSDDAKRARFIAESGIRYALSEIRNSGDLENAAELLNNTSEFKLGKDGSFTVSVFSPGLKSAENKFIFGSGFLTLNVPYDGEFPSDFDIPDVSVVAWDRFKMSTPPTLPPDSSYAALNSATKADPPESVNVHLTDNFQASIGDTICFALQVANAQTNITRGSSIYVHENARHFFPEENGAIRILTLSDGKLYDYFYESRVYDTANNRVELTNLREIPGSGAWRNIPDLQTTDYVTLSPYNFRLFASGKSDETEIKIGQNKAYWAVAVPSEYTIYMRELLQDKEIKQYGDVIRAPDAGDKKIELGAGGGGSEGFGDLWYSGNKAIGGNTNRCKQGRCIFNEGIRTFFTVKLSGDGEGFTFALIGGGNAADTITPANTIASAGGDIELPELLAYGGSSWAGGSTGYLDGSGGEGLKAPKMAIEFDTRTNLDEPLDYCSSQFNLKENSRNDPQPGGLNKDVIQYVFWGSDDGNDLDSLDCRSVAKESYDDNRHNAEGAELSQNWTFETGGEISLGRPAIASNSSIYMSAMDATLYAFNPDGTVKWTFNTSNNSDYAPGIDRTGGPHDGTIYSDFDFGNLVAINPDGTEKWRVDVGADIDSTPAVGPDGSIYFGTDSGKIIKLNPDGTINWTFATGGEVDTSPALSPPPASSVVYAVSNDNHLYALNTTTGLKIWDFPILTQPNEINSSPTVNPGDGTIYVGSDDHNVYAINPGGTEKWRYTTGSDVESTAGLDPNDGTIYIGADDGKVYAIKPDGSSKGLGWPFSTGSAVESSPIVGTDGTVFVGSSNSKVYAIDPNGIKLWEFSTGAGVPSSPALDNYGFVLVGSNDNNLYSIATAAVPRNYRTDHPDFYSVPTSPRDYRNDYDFSQKAFLIDKDLQAGADIDVENDWLNGGSLLFPWAVRMEIEKVAARTYELKTWIRQCTIGDCSDIKDTLFQNTERKYDYSPLTYPSSTIKRQPMVQRITMTASEDEQFERILFGTTTAASSGDSQLTTIRDFQLTFIETAREETAVLNDPDWP